AGGRSSVVPEDSPNTSHLPMATGLPAWHFDDLQTGTPQDAREVGQHHDRSLPLGYGAAPVIGTGEIAWRSADHLGRGASVFPSGSRRTRGTAFSLRTRRSLFTLRSLRARLPVFPGRPRFSVLPRLALGATGSAFSVSTITAVGSRLYSVPLLYWNNLDDGLAAHVFNLLL